LGTRAFPRFGPCLFIDDYSIICYHHTEDLNDIRTLAAVECVQERVSPSEPPCRDTVTLLQHPLLTQTGKLPEPGAWLLVYQENPELRRLALERDWKLMANPFEMRMRWENKAFFRRSIRDAGLAVPPGSIVAVDDLTSRNYRAWCKKWGEKLVVQIPDFPRGGGRATFFLESASELAELRKRWAARTHRGHAFLEVSVSAWIEGPSLSMVGCVCPGDVLLSPLQTQFVDLDEVLPPGRGGRFWGHQWGLSD
jgi:hypothetical protein